MNEHQDYYDMLIPFVKISISKIDSQNITSEQVRISLLETSGLDLPINIVDRLLVKLIDRNILSRKENVIVVKNKIRTTEIEEAINRNTKQFDIIKENFIQFCNSKDIKINENFNFMSEIINFLQLHSYDLLVKDFSIKKRDTTGKLWPIAQFIKYLHDNNLAEFEIISSFFQGFLLYQSVTHEEDCSDFKSNYANCLFLFDTRLILALIGLSSPEEEKSIHELTNLLLAYKAKIAFFDRTKDEVVGIIMDTARNLNDTTIKTIKTALRAARSQKISIAGLMQIKIEFTSTLKLKGIDQIDVPQRDPNYVIDEKKLEELINLEYDRERSPAANRHDIDCIAAIYQFREGKSTKKINENAAIFITHNSALAKAVRNFINAENNNMHEFPPIVTDYWLINRLWLLAPSKNSKIIDNALLAHSISCLEKITIRNEHIQHELDDLLRKEKIDNETYYKLRAHSSEIADFTLSNDKTLSEKTLPEIIEFTAQKFEALVEKKIEPISKQLQESEQTIQSLLEKSYKLKRDRRVRQKAKLRQSIRILNCGFIIFICGTSFLIVKYSTYFINLIKYPILVFPIKIVIYLTAFAIIYIKLEPWIFPKGPLRSISHKVFSGLRRSFIKAAHFRARSVH